jgi:peptidoglycan/LPS O-acetylase OafA/YrhL
VAESVRQEARLGWLDGLRGLAAIQVVLMHYVFAFAPAIASIYPLNIHGFSVRGLAGTPLVFLYDGNSAVFLFFIMSGAALTHAFAACPFDFVPAVIRRMIRLGLPMAAAVVLAAGLFVLLPDAHVGAAERSGSAAMRYSGPGEISIAKIIHQIAFEGLLTGFSGSSLLPDWAARSIGLVPRDYGIDTPLWTLHVEFCGSLLVMLLVAVRAATGRAIYCATCVVLGCAFVLSPLSLFIIGHFAAAHMWRIDGRGWQMFLGVAFLGSGILFCTTQIVGPLSIVWALLSLPLVGIPGDPMVLQKMIGAVLVFGGLVLLPVLQRHLERPVPRWLGRISFSLYLFHYPLLFTCVAAYFTLLHNLPYSVSAAAASAAGIAISLAVAVPFERWIDRPAIRLSRMAGLSRRRTVTSVLLVPAAPAN